jgi:glycosyltransferase involved in cell wall biosynthesis
LPVHGEAPFLDETIRSVLAQTVDSWELLLILDRPTETTLNICNLASSSDSRIQVHNSQQIGISSALNLGIKESKGSLIARIDADDVMKKNRLMTQIEFLANNPEIVCVGSQAEFIDLNGELTGRSSFPTSPKEIRITIPFLNPIIHPSVLMRKSSLEEVGGYNSVLDGVEDYNLWLRLAELGDLANLEVALVYYRRHEMQVTKGNSDINIHLQSLARLDNLALLPKLLEESWAKRLSRLKPKERIAEISSLERVASREARIFLRASKGFSIFLSSTGLGRIPGLTTALSITPARTIQTLWILLMHKWSA